MQENFFDRKTYLNLLEKRIRGFKDGYRQNIAIIGDELLGKTSLIFNLLNKFYDNHIIILYLEIRPETFVSFAKRFIGILLYNFLINSNIPLKEDLDFLMKKSSRYIPETIEKIKSILNAIEKRKRNNVFTEILSLCEVVYQETGKLCIVIFDEFHNLENLGIKDLYTGWSKMLILQKHTMYIIVSSKKFKTKIILSKNLSLLFGNFEIVSVEPFDTKTSEEYIRYNLMDLNLNQGMINFIIHFTGGYPFYLKAISETLLKSDRVSLVDILEDLLFDSSGLFNQRFSNYLKHFLDSNYSQDYLSILYLISNGQNKIKDIVHILRKPHKELRIRINHLLEFDTINRNGDFLKINDRVFGFWLKFVYRAKMQSLTFDSKNQKLFFRENIENAINEFLINASKSIVERLMELLDLFQDDKIQIEKKRLTLSHFREIKPLEFNKDNLKEGLICRSRDNLWILGFKHDLLTEEDIIGFAKECKKYHHKSQKKIIIAFQSIDANARLRALEEKILTWDLSNLNQILDLFSKPRIIV